MTRTVNAMRQEWVQEKGLASLDFLVLTLHVLKKDRALFFKERDHILTEDEYHTLTKLLEKRLLSEPVAYLTGSKDFFGKSFIVTKDTLIPRPESECLVEDVLSFGKNTRKPDYVLDIGTGSGALIITLASEFATNATKFIGSDISQKALIVAEKNKKNHKAPVTFLLGSLLDPYKKLALNEYSQVYIIANLPYLSVQLFESAPTDVQNYEPRSALVSENEGLAHYQALFEEIKSLPKLSGTCWIEISPEQKEKITKYIYTSFPGTNLFIGQDLSQKDRFIRFTF